MQIQQPISLRSANSQLLGEQPDQQPGKKGQNEIREENPSNTLYINNLNEKVKIDNLKQALQQVFSKHGEILSIYAKKNIKMRGQAFIVFKSITSAVNAKEEFSEVELYGKQMKIHFSRSKSDVIAKLDGTYVKRERQAGLSIKEELDKKKEEKLRIAREKLQQQQQLLQQQTQSQQQALQQQQKYIVKQTIVPNNILIVENLSSDITQDKLIEMFQNFAGYKEVRMVPSKKVAFVEYEDETKAGNAMTALVGVKIGDYSMQVTYAKR